MLKLELWNIFYEGIQKKYKGIGYIKIKNSQNKLDYIRDILQLIKMYI